MVTVGHRAGRFVRLPILLSLLFALSHGGDLAAGTLDLRRPPAAPVADARQQQPRAEPSESDPFPHLLFDRSARKSQHRRGLAVRPPNALWQPGDLLPPSVSSPERRARALAIAGATDPEARRAAMRQSLGSAAPDTQRILVLRVDFLADTPGNRTTGDGRFDLRDSTDVLFDPPPHDKKYFERHMDALKRYYDVALQGALVLEYDVWPAENDSAYHLRDTLPYGPWIFSNNNPDVLQHAIDLVGDALAVADTTDPEIDFSCYQHFLLFHAGPDFQGDVNRDTPWDIPSFNLFVTDPFVVQDSVAINLVMVVPETVAQDGFMGALNGVITHEFGHQLGFIDLYDVRNGLPVVGAYSLMDSGDNLFALIEDPDQPGRNLAVRGTLPASVDPFHKTLFFPESVQLLDLAELGTERLETELESVQLGNEIVSVPLNLSEYFLIENRHLDLNGDATVIIRQDPETGVILGPEPDSSAVGDTLGFREYDWLIPGEGILVWRIDWLGINSGYALPGGGANVIFSRPGVSVVEADGIRDIGTASTEFLGGPHDPFFRGGYDRLGPDTVPSSDTADRTRTGITITVLDSIGLSMRVRVESELQPPGWPIRVGAEPSDEEVVVLDLGFGGPSTIVPAFDQRTGPILVRLDHEGGGAAIFAPLADSLQFGLAARSDFSGFADQRGPSPVVAAVTGGRLELFDALGQTLLIWPPIGDPNSDDLAVTATPAVLEEYVVVGSADGGVRLLQVGPEPVATTIPGAGEAIRALAVGRASPEAPFALFSADQSGRLAGGTLTSDLLYSELWPPRASAAGAASIASGNAGLLAVPDSTGALSLLVGWRDGTVEWRNADGSTRSGWPVKAPAPLAGSPLVADLDRDGELETFAADRSGAIHSWAANGHEDFGYPRSIWSEDHLVRDPLRTAPRIFDVDGDGEANLLVHRPDGFLFAWDHEHRPIAGWPLASGAPAIHGPEWVPASGDEPPRLLVGNLDGVTATGVVVEQVSAYRVPDATIEGTGFFPMPGLGPERSRVYPLRWLPGPQRAPSGLSELIFYPNPVRGDLVTIRVVVGEAASVSLDAYDLAGKRVAGTELALHGGSGGNQLAWNISSLASGLYHVRARIRGDGWSEERFERLAVVR